MPLPAGTTVRATPEPPPAFAALAHARALAGAPLLAAASHPPLQAHVIPKGRREYSPAIYTARTLCSCLKNRLSPRPRPTARVCTRVWAHTGSEQSFEMGTIERHDAHKGTYDVQLKRGIISIKEADVHKVNAANQDGVPDNTYLRELNEATLLHNVRVRYNHPKDDGGCYSVTGHILIAVNPSARSTSTRRATTSGTCRSRSARSRTSTRRPTAVPPLVSSGDSQAIIVSGPSGSGKTETCKYVLRHLAFVSRDKAASGAKSSQELGRLLVQTNPLLEAFGNAETVLNKNSSRLASSSRCWSRGRARSSARRSTPTCWTTRGDARREGVQLPHQLPAHLRRVLQGAPLTSSRRSRAYAYLRSAGGAATARRGEDPANFREVVGVFELLRVKPEMQQALFSVLRPALARLGRLQREPQRRGHHRLARRPQARTPSSAPTSRCCSRRSARAR